MLKKIIFITIFCFFTASILFAQSGANITTADSKSITSMTESVLKGLKIKDISKVTPYLYDGMRVAPLSSDELRGLTIDFIDNSISEFRYRIKMSGNNLAFFLKDKGRIFVSYQLSKPIYVSSIMGDNGKKINYYFLYVNALYQNIIKDEQGNTSLVPVEIQIEMQIAKVRNQFKVIGFII